MWGRTCTLNVLETRGSPNRRIHVTRNTKLYPDSAADWRWNPVLDLFFVSRVIARMFTRYKNINICRVSKAIFIFTMRYFDNRMCTFKDWKTFILNIDILSPFCWYWQVTKTVLVFVDSSYIFVIIEDKICHSLMNKKFM